MKSFFNYIIHLFGFSPRSGRTPKGSYAEYAEKVKSGELVTKDDLRRYWDERYEDAIKLLDTDSDAEMDKLIKKESNKYL